ncbi:restriction endonuclease subunit S [Hymenobacter oligotrophus]|uniref:Restriction endonuclease subunit S n=1 Tax=Hymenobacter oligotrophus TaxID=2319843 RepID=A0A3B7R9T7_9BACT|nr:restriction endonuclease subunit S [Hymenobacter oligotrophus]AYA37831.1 restriction endonuclease subunit S [Hymenobacter oligotrophus]
MSWEVVKLGSVCKVLPGFAFKSQLMGSSGIPVIKIKNINDNLGVDTLDCQCIDEAYVPEKLAKFFVSKGDILLAMTGATAGKFGRVHDNGRYLLNQRVAKIIPFDADADYIWSCLSDSKYRDLLFNIGQGAAQPNISGGQIEALDIPLPPKPVQKKISSIISAYNDLIDNNRKRIALLEKAARLLYEEWFVRLRFPGHEHTPVVDGVPVGWEKDDIRSCSSYISRGISPSYDEEAPGLVINQKCIRNNQVDLTPARNQKKPFKDDKQVLKGDVLINSTGAGTLGRVAQLWKDLPNCTVDSHVTIVRPKAESGICWLGYQLSVLEPLLENMGEGSTNQKELGRDRIASLRVLVPSSSIQHAFDQVVAPVKEQMNVLSAQNQKLQQARDLLLPRLMSGELAV